MKQYNIMFDNVHSATMHDNVNQSSNVGHTIRLANNIHKAIQYKATKLKRYQLMSMKQYNIMFDNVHSATMHDNLNQSSKVGDTIRLANNVHKVIQYKAIS